jgi:threonine dehydratase
VALAAALCRKDQIGGGAVICTVSGGNVDPQMFGRGLATL